MKVILAGSSLMNFKTSELSKREIVTNKPNCKNITNAFMNKDNHLIIKSISTEDIKELNKPWPGNAFIAGIQIVEKKHIFYAAINNVDPQEDLTDPETATFLENQYGIIKFKRLTKKLENKKYRPLRTIKIEVNNKGKYDNMIKEGIKLGYTRFRVTEWKFENGPIQCLNCQNYGHKSQTCTEPKRCLFCAHTRRPLTHRM